MIAAHRRDRLVCVVAFLGCTAVFIGLLCLAARYADRWMNEPDLSRAEAIEPGMAQRQVMARLGEPAYVYNAGDAPEDYYVLGYTYRRRPISNKVLIYFGGTDLIVYVYIDEAGEVEDVYIGGS